MPNLTNLTEDLQGEYLQNLSREDLETLMQLGGLSVPQLMGEVTMVGLSGNFQLSAPRLRGCRTLPTS